MECKNCHSRWEPSQNASKTLTVCPFCGADLAAADGGSRGIYDNSKDALAHIMREHGADVLLGSSLKNFFNDYAPGIKRGRKNVVFFVIESGAAGILKKNLGAGAEEQEIAFRRAVQKVVEEYATERSEVESVMLEFTAALGWKVNIQSQKQQTSPDPKQAQTPPTSQNQQTPPKPAPQKQTSPTPAQQKPPAPVQTSLGDLMPGQRNVPFGKYLWHVLDVQNGRALLLAEEVLEERWYHSKRRGVTWKKCKLRKYLNGKFLRGFNSSEQERIAETENINKDNPWYGTSGGRSTVDRVFLLSIEEVVKYLGDSGDLRARKGWYWENGYWENGKYVLKDGKGDCINDQYNSARIAKYRGETACWWLRSPGFYDFTVACVGKGGRLVMSGCSVANDVYRDENGWTVFAIAARGVRPALWLNL